MDGSFDFTTRMRALCADMTARLPELQHIDLARVMIAFSQARKRVHHGLFATLTPLRFEGGNVEGLQRGRRYRIQRVVDSSGREMLYILSFYLPRFMDLTFQDKLVTVLHELWHISPAFDGDLRRHPGRCYAHSHSQKNYDAQMELLGKRWLALEPPLELYDFLRCNFRELQRCYGAIYGLRVRQPKLIPVRKQ